MPRLILLFAALAALGLAQASEVFVTKDAEGRTVYTDRPESLPAQKVKVATGNTNTVDAQNQNSERMQATAAAEKSNAAAASQAAEAREAKELTAADKAKRCVEARARYEQVMTAQRLYEPGANEGERRYLDSKEIDAARASSKQAMDALCADQ